MPPDGVLTGSLPGDSPTTFASKLTSDPVSADTEMSDGLATDTRAFIPDHARQQSLGTTKTSPSTRRRSVESTMYLIREAVEVGTDESHLAGLQS